MSPKKIETAYGTKKSVPVLICGGIGFYIGSFFSGLLEPVSLKADGRIIFKNKKYQKLFIQLNDKTNN